MLENCDYVLCLMIDFSHVFDVINHPILLEKLSQLDLPDFAFNWIVSFLTDRTQAVRAHGVLSSFKHIRLTLVLFSDWSGIRPTLYIVMENDLRTNCLHAIGCVKLQPMPAFWFHLTLMKASLMNLVAWKNGHWKIRWPLICKKPEIVFHRPSLRTFVYPAPADSI